MVQNAGHLKSSAPETQRGRDPNAMQQRASDPCASVWVSASAGTGKTKVLTDRVLRLMLPRVDGQPGTPPHKILGITFTRAGASEMALRINEILARWAVLEPDRLESTLAELLQRKPAPIDTETARRLFADVIDTPGGLKIMTIHSFCQSVLSRFPLEAGLPPHFVLLQETDAKLLLSRARDRALREAESNPATPLGQALRHVAATVNAEQFLGLISAVSSERGQMAALMQRHFGPQGLYTALCAKLGLPEGKTAKDLALEACADRAFDHEGLRNAARILGTSTGKTEPQYAAVIAGWLAMDPPGRLAALPGYRAVFLTTENEPREKNFPTTKITGSHPECVPVLRAESARLMALQEAINASTCAELTRDLLTLGEAVTSHYSALKTEKAALDFDDLILTTVALLEGRTASVKTGNPAGWVLYKLDNGIDHILIDEAQDTNADQWKIIKALCEDFFAGKTAHEHTRTIFTVGDEKQSIYGFQRASPEEFSRTHNYFKKRIHEAGEVFDDVSLDISFRSTQSVLQAVDATFAPEGVRKGLGLAPVEHQSYHYWRGGRTEIWPLYEAPETEDMDFWAPPTRLIDAKSSSSQLAERIALTIKTWLDQGKKLPSYGRAIQPGDIMILVRTRTAFFAQLARALKTNNIPVSGVDRMVLGEQLAVQDLLAVAEFALMPGDNLTLACILKSPLIGMTEEALFTIAHNRGETESLWSALQKSTHKSTVTYLADFIALAREAHPYEFFSLILQRPCPADFISGLRAITSRLGDDAIDPLDELLSLTLEYETANTPSLQGFLYWQGREQTEIKRQLSEHTSQVRIMTVHGSKGLQAPIVILPDTVRSSRTVPGQMGRRLIWPDKSGLDFPLWSPRKNSDFDLYRRAAAALDERNDEEYRRLLYVAMTRAEDQLYVCGYKGKNNILPTSWYNYVRDGLESLPSVETLEDGSIVLNKEQTRDVDRKKTAEVPTGLSGDLPRWLYEFAPKEREEASVLQPSRGDDSGQPAGSPRTHGRTHRFRRGNLTHKLLQILPQVPPAARESAAGAFITRFGADLPGAVQTEIVSESLAVLSDARFAAIFGPGSQAEVPITGTTPQGQPISGQIDRLLVTEREILIVDYKTNRPPPRMAADIPPAYRRQLQAYADTLRGIYPGRAINAALLWTDGPLLMAIELD